MKLSFFYYYQKISYRLKQIFVGAFDYLAFIFLSPIRTLLPANPNVKNVVFVGRALQARIPRMAKWLGRTGKFECFLIVETGKSISHFNENHFSQIFFYRTKWELKRILKGLENVYVLHGICTPTAHIRYAIEETNFPVILDIQDMYVSYYGLNPPYYYLKKELPNEAFCLEHSDGVIAQSLEPYYAYQAYRITTRPPLLYFPLYCDDDVLSTKARNSTETETHIVYAGTIAGSFQSKDHDGSKHFWVIDVLSKQNIHYHIYHSPNMAFQKEIVQEYREIEKSNPYFHLHAAVPIDDLQEEIAKYDFGLIPFFNAKNSRGVEKRNRNTSLKLFNYIESGVPPIVSADLKYQSWIAKRYGGGISITFEGLQKLNEVISEKIYNERLDELEKNRKGILLGKHTDRLIQFYAKVVERKQAPTP